VLFFLPLLEGELSKHLNSSKKEDTQESSSDVDDSEEWSRNSEDSKDSDSEYEDSHPQKKKIKAEVNEEAPSTSCPSAINAEGHQVSLGDPRPDFQTKYTRVLATSYRIAIFTVLPWCWCHGLTGSLTSTVL
jgi:hypothetical protein